VGIRVVRFSLKFSLLSVGFAICLGPSFLFVFSLVEQLGDMLLMICFGGNLPRDMLHSTSIL